MLDTFSKSIIFKQMPPPQAPTLFVELVQFHAGSDAGITSASSSSHPIGHAPLPSYPTPPPLPPSYAYPHHGPPIMTHPPPPPSMSSSHAPGAPPPPPWSRWAPMSTPKVPPSTQRRAANGEGPRMSVPPPLPPSTSRKRKHTDDMSDYHHHYSHVPRLEDDNRLNSSYPLKRHAGPSLTPTPASTPPRPVQTLSPSLAMIVSPTNQAVHTSPRGTQLAPLMRNGTTSGSPVLPPVKSLIAGDSRGPPL